MSDPFALFSLAIATAGGRVDAFDAQQLVAAGLTLKQRSVALVKALSTGRAAILLPPSPAFLVALAASDGCGALLIDPAHSADEIAWQLTDANVRAIFTINSLATRVGAERTIVSLDGAPFTARVLSGGRTIDVDLGSHHGLELEGDQTAEGRDEECVLYYERASDGESQRIARTHRELLKSAREQVGSFALDGAAYRASRAWSEPNELTRVAAALLAGARVETGAQAAAAKSKQQLTITDKN